METKYVRLLVIPLTAIVLIAVALIAINYYQPLSIGALIHYQILINALIRAHPAMALATYIACCCVAGGLALPGGVVLNIAGGFFFGGIIGGAATITGTTVGTAGTFVIVKFAIRPWLLSWFGPQAHRFAAEFRADGFSLLLAMRLIPIVPFSLANILPALCDVPLGAFVAATVIGITPMTMAIAIFGAGMENALAAPITEFRNCLATGKPDCQFHFSWWTAVTPQFVIGLFALGIAVLLSVIVGRYRRRKAEPFR